MCDIIKEKAAKSPAGLGGHIMLELSKVFDDYPNPIYIVKPIVANGVSEDFEYIYVNTAFCLFIGRSFDELVGHTYLECFKTPGERIWLDLFVDAGIGRKHAYADYVSYVIKRKMYTEVFHIEPNLCGCVIHDFKKVSDDIIDNENERLRHKANDDCLTGFYNRFYLNEQYDDISAKKNIGITFLDINNLRLINNLNGHAAGDERILLIAHMIRAIYKNSSVFRIGGDEFVIITQNTTQDEFLKMSEKSQNEFESENLASIGFRFYETIADLWGCINECDSIMFENKRKLRKKFEK